MKKFTAQTTVQTPPSYSDNPSAPIPSITTTAASATTSVDKGGRAAALIKSSRRNTSPLLPRHAELTTGVVQGKMKTMFADSALAGQGSTMTSEISTSHNTLDDDETDTGNGSVTSEDHVDGEDAARTRATREQYLAKIDHYMEQLKSEQKRKEENVNEYLRLSRNADKQQLSSSRIKGVFEKKNKALTHSVATIQRKLDVYEHKLEQLGKHGIGTSHKSRHVLKDMGQGLKVLFSRDTRSRDASPNRGVVDSVRGAKDSIVSKPKEFAHLIKNKFGSADNINSLKHLDESELNVEDYAPDTDKHSHYSSNVPHSSFRISHSEDGDEAPSVASTGSNASIAQSGAHSGIQSSPHPRSDSLANVRPAQESAADEAALEASKVAELQMFMRQLTQQQLKLQDTIESLRVHVEEESSYFKQACEEERYRAKCMEEQINDLSELHQHEVTNIKQELQSMEEKMEYQLEERTRDMQELLETCQTRITKMELQQQQQQLISVEAFENSNFRNLITKLINVVLAVLAVILVLVSTVANILGPFIYSRFRIVSTIVLIAAIIVSWRNWTKVQDLGDHLQDTYGHLLPWNR